MAGNDESVSQFELAYHDGMPIHTRYRHQIGLSLPGQGLAEVLGNEEIFRGPLIGLIKVSMWW